MNFLNNLGSSLHFLHFAKQQLLGMHTLIDAKQIPAKKSDDFFQQTHNLEQALGDATYAQSIKRYQTAKKGVIITASAILVFAMMIYALLKFGSDNGVIQQAIRSLMADFVLFATTISVIAGVLFVVLIGGQLYIRSLEKKLLGKDLSALWARILNRWLPELASQHDIAHIEPESIAPLVAVQARIQDVDLELDKARRDEQGSATA